MAPGRDEESLLNFQTNIMSHPFHNIRNILLFLLRKRMRFRKKFLNISHNFRSIPADFVVNNWPQCSNIKINTSPTLLVF